MKACFFLFFACCLPVFGCTGRHPAASGADPAAAVAGTPVASSGKIAGRDTGICQLPECALVYTDTLPAACKGTAIRMQTRTGTYRPDVKVIDVQVVNPTPVPLSFGREWRLQVWKNGKWVLPETKKPAVSWQSDGFRVDKAPLCYYFGFPAGDLYQLPPGRYRIGKTFYRGTEEIVTQAEFEIK